MNILNLTLSGNLTKDATCKTFDSGKTVFNFTIAHNLSTKKDGDKVFYASCNFWVGETENTLKLKNYLTDKLKKGQKVVIQSDYIEEKKGTDKEGNNYRNLSIRVSKIDMI